MVSLESQSTPREVGSEYGAWSGASDGLHTAGEVPPPPRGTPLSFVWRAKWVVLVLVVVCGAAALLALMRAVPASLPQSVESVPENGLGMDMRDVNGPRVLGRGFPASSAAPRPMRASGSLRWRKSKRYRPP